MRISDLQARDLSKSMLAAKSFVHTTDMVALERWMGILADELSDRMIYDTQVNQRFPRNLVLSYRQAWNSASFHNLCFPFPWFVKSQGSRKPAPTRFEKLENLRVPSRGTGKENFTLTNEQYPGAPLLLILILLAQNIPMATNTIRTRRILL